MKLIFLNLFIAIILQGFDDTNQRENKLFNNDTATVFRDKWAEFDPDGISFIPLTQLNDLLFELGPPLGWDDTYLDDSDKQDEFIQELNLPLYNNMADI